MRSFKLFFKMLQLVDEKDVTLAEMQKSVDEVMPVYLIFRTVYDELDE